MSRLIYSVIASLDGYVNDRDGGFGWARPDDEVHAHVNEGERGVGTYLYGRRLHEIMTFWETAEDNEPGPEADFARLWRKADKVVFSRTLTSVDTSRTQLRSTFDAAEVARLVADSPGDVSIGGPTLAAEALRAGLVDSCRIYLCPVVVGGGTPWLPTDVQLALTLTDEHRFSSGFVYLEYDVVR